MNRQDCPYQAFYCEENIWQLCQQNPFKNSQTKVCFIFNAMNCVPMLAQRAAKGRFEAAFWDYHVILLQQKDELWQVWDLDSLLPFPISLANYLNASFSESIPSIYQPSFRVLNSPLFLEEFCSDRSHMLDAFGHYHAPVPNWPAPARAGEQSNLLSFINEKSFVGIIYDQASLRHTFVD
jgi:protein N-terminal glutamine amidohydrolase